MDNDEICMEALEAVAEMPIPPFWLTVMIVVVGALIVFEFFGDDCADTHCLNGATAALVNYACVCGARGE